MPIVFSLFNNVDLIIGVRTMLTLIKPSTITYKRIRQSLRITVPITIYCILPCCIKWIVIWYPAVVQASILVRFGIKAQDLIFIIIPLLSVIGSAGVAKL